MKELPKRKPNRLQNYDYNQNGAYFITVCTKNRHEILCTITVGDAALGVPFVKLSEYGEIVRMFIENIPKTNSSVFVPKYVIMPNHIHLILIIESKNIKTPKKNIHGTPDTIHGTSDTIHGTPRAASPTKALIPKIINVLKGLSSKKIGFSLWQRSYHDHVIRNEADYYRIEEYIENNPTYWDEDCFYRDIHL